MLIENQHPHNRSIVASVLGRPNAGKSSMINQMLGYDLSIVSSKPQTTRNRFHCVINVDRTEIVFVDSPGVHKSGQEINIRMNNEASIASEGADVNLILLDLTAGNLEREFKDFIELMPKSLGKAWVVFTKSDLKAVTPAFLDAEFAKFKIILPTLEKYFVISSKSGENIHDLTGALVDASTNSPHLYPNGDVSNKNMRFFVSEYIREQMFRLLQEEVPYETAVVVEEYKDVDPDQDSAVIARIAATILVNRPSQRAIVVGTQGKNIKEIGSKARAKIEALLGGQVMLNLHVKVTEKWFKNNMILEELGLSRSEKSHRVWRKR